MSSLSISDVHVSGSNLFTGSENYLRDLSEIEVCVNSGGENISLLTSISPISPFTPFFEHSAAATVL